MKDHIKYETGINIAKYCYQPIYSFCIVLEFIIIPELAFTLIYN